ncbi:MAG TPA: sugar phosphate nucleotidyltransferase [Steroidobacteraceae bacterium]|nr:sugar phosphate nucleotidyltransferase [Steroidobacteraceae bacterium]
MSNGQNRWETHWDAGHNWALVLAAGEGSRLQALTMTASGVAIPKQFCSMGGNDSLLHAALRRARSVATAERTTTVLAQHHRRWWQGLQLGIPPQNVIAQPRNRGTANGILLPLLQIVHRDPQATLLVLPSDHYVRNEEVLATGLRHAIGQVAEHREHIILLGLTPEEADPELGYIVSDGDSASSARAVAEFVEKPNVAAARALIARGGLWNSFIFAADAQALVRLFEARCPAIVSQMQRIVAEQRPDIRDAHLAELYEHLPPLDFSRDILQSSPSALRVLKVPACGWNDLGTPRRVIQVANRYRSHPPADTQPVFLDLAAVPSHRFARIEA